MYIPPLQDTTAVIEVVDMTVDFEEDIKPFLGRRLVRTPTSSFLAILQLQSFWLPSAVTLLCWLPPELLDPCQAVYCPLPCVPPLPACATYSRRLQVTACCCGEPLNGWFRSDVHSIVSQGSGGFGDVFECTWRGQKVAVKRLPASVERQEDAPPPRAQYLALIAEIQLSCRFKCSRLVRAMASLWQIQ